MTMTAEPLAAETAPPTPEAAAMPTETAPYGYRKDGSPAAKRGPKGPRKAASPSGPAGLRPPARKPTPNTRRPAGPDYDAAVRSMLQPVALVLAMAGMRNPTLAADSVAVSSATPGLAAALAQLAAERPEVAAALDRLMRVGPYSALVAALVPLALQLATNHRIIPAGLLGTVTPEELVGAALPAAGSDG